MDRISQKERQKIACTVSNLHTYEYTILIAPTDPALKTRKKYEAEEKLDMELVRRWRVVIEDIEITNQSPKLMNPFIRFTLGGNYYVSVPTS